MAAQDTGGGGGRGRGGHNSSMQRRGGCWPGLEKKSRTCGRPETCIPEIGLAGMEGRRVGGSWVSLAFCRGLVSKRGYACSPFLSPPFPGSVERTTHWISGNSNGRSELGLGSPRAPSPVPHIGFEIPSRVSLGQSRSASPSPSTVHTVPRPLCHLHLHISIYFPPRFYGRHTKKPSDVSIWTSADRTIHVASSFSRRPDAPWNQ